VGGKRITSFRQQEQQVQQRAQRLRQQQVREQMRQQPVRVQLLELVRVQERGFLFCHKRPKRRHLGVAEPMDSEASSTQPLIIG